MALTGRIAVIKFNSGSIADLPLTPEGLVEAIEMFHDGGLWMSIEIQDPAQPGEEVSSIKIGRVGIDPTNLEVYVHVTGKGKWPFMSSDRGQLERTVS